MHVQSSEIAADWLASKIAPLDVHDSSAFGALSLRDSRFANKE
jgi:hypothetical protein